MIAPLGASPTTASPAAPRASLRPDYAQFVARPWLRIARDAMKAVGAAAAIAAIDLLTRQHLPESARVLLPLLAFAAGIVFAARFIGFEPKEESSAGNVADRLDRAAAELAMLPLDLGLRAPAGAGEIRRDWGSRVADSEIIVLPATLPANASVAQASKELDQYHVFTEILSKQMMSITELSGEAANSILENLTKIDGQISALLDFIQSSGSNEQVAKVVAQIEGQMRGCQDLLNRFVETQQADALGGNEQRSKIAAETRRVLDLLEHVDGIARQTRMLSFNVSIEAARAGEFGRGFSVIGDEIRKLASEVRDLSKEVRERVEALTRTITIDLQQVSDERDRAQHAAITNVTKTLSSLSDDLVTLITHQRDTLSKVESENESIARPVMEAMGSIQFQDIIRQQLEQLTSMAEMVGDHIRTVGAMLDDPHGDIDPTSLSQKLDELFGGYVMERQRATHLSARGEAASSAPVARIELF